MKVLETERLLLRPFQLEDKAEIHRLVYADPQVAPFWSSRTWAIEEITESFARQTGATCQRAGLSGDDPQSNRGHDGLNRLSA